MGKAEGGDEYLGAIFFARDWASKLVLCSDYIYIVQRPRNRRRVAKKLPEANIHPTDRCPKPTTNNGIFYSKWIIVS